MEDSFTAAEKLMLIDERGACPTERNKQTKKMSPKHKKKVTVPQLFKFAL